MRSKAFSFYLLFASFLVLGLTAIGTLATCNTHPQAVIQLSRGGYSHSYNHGERLPSAHHGYHSA
jgi:hypothetical protein